MNRRERVLAAVRGEQPDRVPIGLWRHWPMVDQTAEGLANAALTWQATYDFDMIKVTPGTGYATEDWGARLVYKGNREGMREFVERPVKHSADWEKLWPLDLKTGVLGRELQALRLVRAKAGPDVFVLATVFSPLTIARNLAGEDVILQHLREAPAKVERGLAIIAETYGRFVQEALRGGADGLFFAVQQARHDFMSQDAYEQMALPYDRHVVGVAADSGALILLHIHGFNIMFDLIARSLPAQIVNWHDRRTAPTLAEARKLTPCALMGGINEVQTLADGTPAQVTAEIKEAIAQAGSRKFLVGAGCVVLNDTPEANLKAARAAV